MKKTYRMEDLECANCAAKMERAIAKISGVQSVSINFLTQKLVLEAEDGCFEQALHQATQAIRKIEPDCRVVL